MSTKYQCQYRILFNIGVFERSNVARHPIDGIDCDNKYCSSNTPHKQTQKSFGVLIKYAVEDRRGADFRRNNNDVTTIQ
jgi:hypothetical protein